MFKVKYGLKQVLNFKKGNINFFLMKNKLDKNFSVGELEYLKLIST